jgi:radical SAM superfamily enzyme YgiQ (UPF0313 family)
MKKILLINPSGLSLGYNIGLGYLAAVLKKNGFYVKIIDFLNQSGNEKKRLKIAKDYDIIGISIKTLVLDESIKIMNEIKKINPNAILIAGGVHISLDGLNFMKKNKIFDFAFTSDSEESFLDFVSEKEITKVNGIIYRRNNKIIVNSQLQKKIELDDLPYPDFDSFDLKFKNVDNYPLLTSRGCPYNCIYCTVQLVSKKWNYRSINNLINELKLIKNKVKEFHIVDDCFNLNKKRVKDFCHLLIKEKINLKWSCPNGIRADLLDQELVKLMKKSGCYLVNLGIESLDQHVFKSIKKGEKLEDITKAIKLLKKEGLIVIGNFIIGLPNSTFKIDMDSVKKAKKLGLDVSLWYPLSIYPKTEVYDIYVKDKNVYFITDWKKGFKYEFNKDPILTFEKKNYSKKEIIKMFYIANLKSKSYGILIDPKKNILLRAIDLSIIIFKYDPFLIFNHIFNALKILIKFRKVY